MNWSDVMKANATGVLRDRAFSEDDLVPGTRAAGWDPYEVWLSRVKKPRDGAARSQAAGVSNPLMDLPK